MAILSRSSSRLEATELSIEIQLLGDIALLVDGWPVDLGGKRQRSVAAILAMSPGRAVSASALAERMWPDEQPSTALKTVQVYVSRLRRALGPEAGRLRTTPSGYLFDLESDMLDAARFEARLRGYAAVSPTLPATEAIEGLESILGMWRGKALADVATEPFARPEAERLEDLRWSAIEELLARRLQHQGGQDVVAEVRVALLERPDRERLWAILMVALYHDGRQADALAVYHEARLRLAEELAIEPGPTLQDIERRILNQDPGLLDGLPWRPVVATTTPGRDPLIGRSVLLSEVADLVGRHRLVTLSGPGGSGKTRLANAVIDALRGVRETISVDTSAMAGGARLADVVEAALGLPEEVDGQRLPVDADRLGRMILFIDDVDPTRPIADEVRRLLDAAPGLHVLATGRRSSGVDGERLVSVPALELPSGGTPDDVERAPATALFLARARAIDRHHAPLSDAAAADVAALCRRLDGLPLAIELAAARTRILTPGEILQRLAVRGGGVIRRQGGDPRHRSLEAVLAWTFSMLDAEEWRLLEAGAVCSGPFDLDLVGVVASVVEPEVALDALATHGLVAIADDAGGLTRYRLLETVRLVVLDRMRGRIDDLRARHADALLERVSAWEPELEGPDPRRARARLDAVVEQLVAAIEWAERTDPAMAVRLVAAAVTYWIARGTPVAPMRILHRLDTRIPQDDVVRPALVAALTRLGGVTAHETETRTHAHEAVALGRARSIPEVEAEGLYALLMPAADLRSGRAPIDHDRLERLASIADSGPRQRAIVLEVRATDELQRHGPAAALQVLAAGLDQARISDARRRVAYLANGVADALLALDRPADAFDAADEAATVARSFGDLRIEMFGLTTAAIAASWLGRSTDVRMAMARALTIGVVLETRLSIALVLHAIARISASDHRPLDAAWAAGAADAAFRPGRLPGLGDGDDAVARHWREATSEVDRATWDQAFTDGRRASLDAALDAAPRLIDPTVAAPRPNALRPGDLTPRDIEILTAIGSGRDDRQVAATMIMGERELANHLDDLRARLRLSGSADLTRRAEELGLVRPDPRSTPRPHAILRPCLPSRRPPSRPSARA